MFSVIAFEGFVMSNISSSLLATELRTLKQVGSGISLQIVLKKLCLALHDAVLVTVSALYSMV